MFVAGGAFAGIVQLITDKIPESLEYVLTPGWQDLWIVAFTLCNIATLVGIVVKDEVVGLFWESSGLFGACFLTWAYAAAIWIRLDLVRGYHSIMFYFLFGLACAIRWVLIRRVIRKAKKV